MNFKILLLITAPYLLLVSSAIPAGGKAEPKDVAEPKAEIHPGGTISGSEWPRWRGPNGDSIVREASWNPSALSGDPRILWKTNVGKGYSSMAISGGFLYTLGYADRKDTVFCLDAITGEVKWKHSYPSKPGQYIGPKATPTVDEGRVYTVSRGGDLFCFNAENGKVLWQKNIQNDFGLFAPNWGFAGSPCITGDLLVLNAGKSGLALNKINGKTIWASEAATRGGYATPVLFEYNDKQYAAMFGEKALYVVEVKTGKVLSSYGWVTGYDVNAADPLIIGNRIFISSNYGKGSAMLELRGDTLQPLWQNRKIASHFSSHIYLDGYIYGHDSDARRSRGNLVCVDAKTGKAQWTERMGMVSIILIGRKLIILDGKGILHVAEATPTAFKETAKAKVLNRTNWTPPAFAGGRIYCRNIVGDVVSIDVR